jgi:AcrR family transcriptional regulator
VRKKNNKEQEIIQAAYQLFSEKGYNATSIRDICRATKLTPPALYYYIKSKRELLNKVETYVYEESTKIVHPGRSLKDPKKHIEHLVANFTSINFQYRNIIYLIMEKALQAEDEISEQSMKRRTQFNQMLVEQLSEVDKTRLADKNMDLRIAALILVGMSLWVSLWADPENETEQKQITKLVSEFYSRGFLK